MRSGSENFNGPLREGNRDPRPPDENRVPALIGPSSGRDSVLVSKGVGGGCQGLSDGEVVSLNGLSDGSIWMIDQMHFFNPPGPVLFIGEYPERVLLMVT